MAHDCEKITFYAPSNRRGGVKPIPSCEPGQIIVPEDLPVPPNPETPEPAPRVPRPLEVLSTPYTFICDNETDREVYNYDPENNASVQIPAKYLSPVDDPDYIENYYYGSGSAVIVPEGYVTTAIPFSSIPDIASDVLNYIAVSGREIDIEHLLRYGYADLDADERVTQLVNNLVRRYGFTAAQAEALVTLFDDEQLKADKSAYTYGESTLVCAWENTAQEIHCEDPEMAHYYDHPDAVYHAVIPAGTYKSLISQDDADRMAADAAAAMLNCFYISDAVMVSCADLGYEEPVPNTDGRIGTVVVPRGTFTSTVSREDATEQAITYAKSLLVCYYTNLRVVVRCEDDNARNLGVTPTQDNRVEITLEPDRPRISGKGQEITVEAGVIRSNISTEAATQEATLLAESLLECCFVNTARTITCPAYEYTYTDKNGVKKTEYIEASEEKSPKYSMSVEAGVFSSCVSQEEADREAETYIRSLLSCYYCSRAVLPTCVPDYVITEVQSAINRGDYSVLPLNPDNYVNEIDQWSEDATVGAPPGYVCGFDYEQVQQIAETSARTLIHDVRSTSSKCRYTNDFLYAGCYFNDPFGNGSNVLNTKAVYYKAKFPGAGEIPYFVYKANVDTRLNKSISTPEPGTYVTIPAGTISITIDDVPASFKAPDVIETTPFNPLQPDADASPEELPMPGVEVNGEGEITSEAMRVKAYANELALKMAMGMIQCLYANPEKTITCSSIGKPGASTPDGTSAWTIPAGLITGPDYKDVIAAANKLLASMVLCLYPNAPRPCSAGCSGCKFPLTNGFLSFKPDDVTVIGPQSTSVSIPGGMFWADTPEDAAAQALAACALSSPTCEYTTSVEVTATCNAVCKAAGIDITLSEDDKKWGLKFWDNDCDGHRQGLFKEPCFEVIADTSSSTKKDAVKVTVSAGASGSSCTDLLVSATALCVVECQAKAEYAFTNEAMQIRCNNLPGMQDLTNHYYWIPPNTYRGNKEAIRALLRNLRRNYCNAANIRKVGRKGVKVNSIEKDTAQTAEAQEDVTNPTDINKETYAGISGRQVIELGVTFEDGANVGVADNIEEIKDEDNGERVVQINAVDTTYEAGNNITITQTGFDSYSPRYKISADETQISVTATTSESADWFENNEHVLAPLKISTTENGTYTVGSTQEGTEFYLSATRHEFHTPDCIKIDRYDNSDEGPDRYEMYNFSVVTGLGLKKIDNGEPLPVLGYAQKALAVKADPNSPINVSADGVGLSYDGQWFKVENGVLTFKGTSGGGEPTQVTLQPENPDPINMDSGTTLLDPLVISTDGGAYQTGREGSAPAGTSFKLNVVAQVPKTPGCITVLKNTAADQTNVPRCEYFNYELSLGTDKGLKAVDRDDASSRGNGLAAKDLVVDAGAGLDLGLKDGKPGTLHVLTSPPLWINAENEVDFKYDAEWFDVVNGKLTFKEAQLQTLITTIINNAISTASVQVGARGDIMNVTALASTMISYDTTGTISLDGSSGEIVTDVYGD